MGMARIPHWHRWRLESALPPALAVTPGDPAARLAWLNEQVVSDPLLVVLYDAQGGQRHVVAIVEYLGQKAVLDPFESFEILTYSQIILRPFTFRDYEKVSQMSISSKQIRK